jgi:hypothetical protein
MLYDLLRILNLLCPCVYPNSKSNTVALGAPFGVATVSTGPIEHDICSTLRREETSGPLL